MSLPKSTVHGYLRTLRTTGYVVNDAGTYRLGLRLLELGGQAKYRNRLFQVTRIVDRHGLPPRTDRTTTDRGELAVELDSIADRGYGVDWNEQVVGTGVAAVLIVVDERVIGSIGVVCPADRLCDTTYRAELVAAVQRSANVVSVSYQYSP